MLLVSVSHWPWQVYLTSVDSYKVVLAYNAVSYKEGGKENHEGIEIARWILDQRDRE